VGCSISQAAASMLCEAGRQELEEAKISRDDVLDMLGIEPAVRLKCGLLA
jgi:NifU-like protein involved in Fe-S cluster formation